MENFFYNDNFFSDLYECLQYNDIYKDEIENYADDYTLEVYTTTLEPIDTIDAKTIANTIDDDRYSENGADREYSEIINILNENIDFEKITSLLPKMYYADGGKHKFTKQDLLDWVE